MAVKQKMSVRTPIEGLASIENGGDVIDYLLDSEGLNYRSFVEVPSGIQRDQGRHDWYEAHLVDENGVGIVRYIELEASGDSPAFSDLKRHLKRHGSPINELFTVITHRESDEGPLTSPLGDDLRFLRIEEQFSSEDVEVTFDLKYFTVKRYGIEPAYLDYLDDLTVDSGQGRTSLEGDIEDVFSIREVTRSFYQDFGEIFREDLQNAIHGLEDPEANLNPYTRTVVNRVLFLLFIEEKRWLDGDIDYVENKYKEVAEEADMHVYDDFFEPLFFDALSEEGTTESDALGRIPFLNGGLFERKDIEKNVEIDEAFFDKLLSPEEGDNGEPKGFLRRYKISLRESNPSEQELVVDPEFIGRIFEMFMQEDERAEIGAFYTPKELTNYIVKSSLKRYVSTNTSELDEETVITIVSDHEVPESVPTDAVQHLIEQLKSVHVVDPAVGSGAFIIAMMDELVELLDELYDATGEKRDLFELKRDLIDKCLYGVDIDAGGVELCKFRTWLHLVQELDIGHEEFLAANDRYALPNLGFNFMVGNSLVGDENPTDVSQLLDSDDGYQSNIEANFSEKHLQNRIAAKRREFIDAHGEDKSRVKEELLELQQALDDKINWQASGVWMGNVAGEIEEDNTFKWSINFPEVILDGGFDIVIGNPPYEGQDKAEYKQALRRYTSEKHGYEYTAKTDLFQFFVHRGLEILSEKGVFSFIMSDTFLMNRNKTGVRKSLLPHLTELTTVTRDAFDASVETAIFVAQKNTEADEIQYNQSRDTEIDAYTGLSKITRDQIREPVNDDYDVKTLVLDQHQLYTFKQNLYKDSFRNVFYIPSGQNIEWYQRFMTPVMRTYDRWNKEIGNVRSLRASRTEVCKEYLANLEAGDLCLFGLYAEGGRGVKTDNITDYVGVREGTKKAERIRDEGYYNRKDSQITRIVQPNEITDIDTLDSSEKSSGIAEDANWVPAPCVLD
jgi:type I restriction-modification system DNA methylase subunit